MSINFLGRLNNAGSTLLGVVIGAGLLVSVGIYGMAFISSPRSTIQKLSENSNCQEIAQSVISNVRSFENATRVRSWLPTVAAPAIDEAAYVNGGGIVERPGGQVGLLANNQNGNGNGNPYGYSNTIGSIANNLTGQNSTGNRNTAAVTTTGDPFCANGRYTLCDNYDQVEFRNNGSIDFNEIRNTINVRGASIWAQNIFNDNIPTICSTGITLARDQLQALLPTVSTLPSWVTSANLMIREEGPTAVACAAGQTSESGANSGNRFHVEITLSTDTTTGSASCKATAQFEFPSDREPSRLSIGLSNGAGTGFPNVLTGVPSCTCQRDHLDYLANGCPEMTDLRVAISSTESGTLLLCRRNGPGTEVDNVGEYKSCGDQTFTGVQNSFSPDVRSIASYNRPISTTWRMNNLLPRGDEVYEMQVRDVDVGGNFFDTVVRFRVRPPSCPARDSYCPQAPRPPDGCGKSCPQGTHSICNTNIAINYCIGTNYNDDCGNPVCPGSRGQNCADPTSVPCGEPIPDLNGCGSCPGTGYCPPPPPSPTPTPSPGPTPGPSGPPCIPSGEMCGNMGYECGGPSDDQCYRCCNGGNYWIQDDANNPACTAMGMAGPKWRYYFCN